jgi:hypothetical protein
LWFVNDQILKRTPLTYLIIKSHSEGGKTIWHFQSQSFKFSFSNKMLIVVWGWGNFKNETYGEGDNRSLESVM